MSLQTRFIVSVVTLILFLVVVILVVIEQRERKAIFDEQKSKAILIAKYIAQMNSYLLQQWDQYGVQESVNEQIDENLIYIIFYDRNKKPWVSNEFIRTFEPIYTNSILADDAEKEDHFYTRRKMEDPRSREVLRILEMEIPIFVGDSSRRMWSIKIGYSLHEMQVENRRTRFMLILFGVSGLFIGIIGAILLSKRITGPLTKLVEGTIQISGGDFSRKIVINSRDEIGNLAQSFNEMIRQLQLARERMQAANKKLIQAEKLASIGRISASIAHEIRNPLTSVKLNLQKIQENNQLDEEEKEHLNYTQEGVRQIEKFITQLLNFARISELHKHKFSIEQVMDESVKMISDSLELKSIILKKTYSKNLPQIWLDGDKMRQVFINILRNSCEAVTPGGEIGVSISHLTVLDENRISIAIADNGNGIPQEDWETVFEPFYTTKSSGIGLGLANARKIVENHMGSIKIIKKEGKGSAFEILLPIKGEP
jgi:signal transduction histidine kinase